IGPSNGNKPTTSALVSAPSTRRIVTSLSVATAKTSTSSSGAGRGATTTGLGTGVGNMVRTTPNTTPQSSTILAANTLAPNQERLVGGSLIGCWRCVSIRSSRRFQVAG